MRPLLSLLFAVACLRAQDNLIGNGTFDRDVEGWSQWFSPGLAEGEATWRARDGGGAMHVSVRKRLNASAVQIYHGPFPVTALAWYSIEFEARAEAATTFRLAFMRNNPPYDALGLSAEVALGTSWRSYAFLVQGAKTVEDGRLDFFLPEGECELDNVAVRPLAGEPPRAEVRAVHVGRSVSGQAPHLVDGDPATRIWIGGYPVMPAFVTLDLGEEVPVARVVIQSEDRGKHLAMGRMECEVSRDGADWRRWAVFAKTVLERRGDLRPTMLAASGGGVPARYVRLRILNVSNSAPLREAAVFRAATADPGAILDLPAVPPSSLLAFRGWDYQRNGYDLSPGEPLALRFANQGNIAVATAFSWRLETYAGDVLRRGEARATVEQGAEADVPLAAPDDLADGHYRVRFSFADTEEEQAFHFDFRRATATAEIPILRLGAYLDTQDPEGWIRLSAGPLAKHLDVQRRITPGTRPDALLVAAEAWPDDDARVAEVREFVRTGGLAVCYGKAAPAFADLLPVAIDYANPRLDTPVTLDGKTLGLPGTPLRQRAVRATAKPDATVLASWSDGTPAVVSGTFGQGRVVFVGAGMGRAWTREELAETPADRLLFPLLYALLHGDAAADAARRVLADGANNWCRQRPDTLTVGRFGWNVAEGGLVENIGDTGRLSCPATKGTWGPRIPGREIARGVPDPPNWLAKRIRWLDEAGAELAATTVSIGAPCMLWETTERTLEIECGAPFAVCEVDGRTTVLAPDGALEGARLSAGWFLLPGANTGEPDAPRYVQFARRPERIRLADGLLHVQFAESCGAFWTGRLLGIRRFAPGVTAAWATEGVPTETHEQARNLARICLAFPTGVEEEGEQIEGEAFWRVRNRFRFRETADEFGTRPLVLAPVPPVFALVHAQSPHLARIPEGTVQPTGVATKYGPLVGIPGDRLAYEISQVADEHYGVVPTKAGDPMQDLIDTHGRLASKVAERAPAGLVSSGSSYLDDLREYMGCSAFRPPFAAPCLDLYKWWYCFPAVAGRPAYSPEAREEIDRHYLRVYRDTLDLYPHKTIVRYRRDPWTRFDYTVSFIWPVVWRNGVRFFVDQNESSAVIAYCLWTYAQYHGDWDTVRANWHLARWLWAYLPRVQDWGLMCSSNQEYFSTAGIDMLNSEYPGNLAFARMARMVGDPHAERLARHLAAKSSIPAVARFLLPAYIESITAEGDRWRNWRFHWSMHENGLEGSETVIMRGDSWSILQLGIGMYDTSKGTGPEIAALYQAFVPRQIQAYQLALADAEKEYGEAVGWAHLMSRAFLGWPQEELAATRPALLPEEGHARLAVSQVPPTISPPPRPRARASISSNGNRRPT